MTVTQTDATDPSILDFIDASVRELQEAGEEPRYILAGPEAYEALRHAIAERYGRSAGTFENYQWLSVVLDPYRGAAVCVLPTPRALVEGVRSLTV